MQLKSYRCVYAPLLFSVTVCMFWEIAIAALPTFPEKLLGMSSKLLCWIKYLVSLNSTHGGSHVGLIWKITISGRPKKLSKTLLIHMKKFIFIKIASSSSKPSVINPCQKEQVGEIRKGQVGEIRNCQNSSFSHNFCHWL